MKDSARSRIMPQSGQVVVHKKDGSVVKGMLEPESAHGPVPVDGHPFYALHIRSVSPGECILVQPEDTKAIFFVRDHDGKADHEEVKFFADVDARELWIRLRFTDGEVIEGRTDNNNALLSSAGFWLEPFDSTGNNLLIYVHKSAIADFHIMGVAMPRADRAIMGGSLAASVSATKH